MVENEITTARDAAMPALEHDLEGRVLRLPRPHTWRAALFPVFEAAMNGIQALQGEERNGTVSVDIVRGDNGNWEVTVSDNGPGLTSENFKAFQRLDTTHKIAIGGKGVGRLMWLAAFDRVHVRSTFVDDDGQLRERSFTFRLDNDDTIEGLIEAPCKGQAEATGFTVQMANPRAPYREHFKKIAPKQIIEAFLAHFVPVLSLTEGIDLLVTIDGECQEIGSLLQEMVVRKQKEVIHDNKRGEFQLLLLECRKAVTAGEKCNNYVIAAAHRRAVAHQPIDNLIGLDHIGRHNGEKTVLLAVLDGKYLDDHVNQERTDFTFETEKNLAELVKDVCIPVVEEFAADALEAERMAQRKKLIAVVREYPSLSIAPTETLQGYLKLSDNYLKLSDKKPESIYQSLAIHKYRADERRKKEINEVLRTSRDDKGVLVPDDFQKHVMKVLAEVGQADRNQLAEYVVRRRVLLELLEALIGIGERGRFALEDALHTLIVERGKSSMGKKAVPVAHDLWIIDESLVFAKAVASDVQMGDISPEPPDDLKTKRPDIAVFDKMIAFGEGHEPDRIFIVEFKRPMREKYDKPVLEQIDDYIHGLKSGGIFGLDGRPVLVRDSCEFQCFVVADIVGDLKRETRHWIGTDRGWGRLHQYGSGSPIRGFVEVIAWNRLIERARQRNRAFFEQAGLPE